METLREKPASATLAEISEQIAILAAIRKSEEAADVGRVIPPEQVGDRLAS